MRWSIILGWMTLSSSMGISLPVGAVPPENPFASILARNVFGLRPNPANAEADSAPAMPPVKIVPNGIMTLFGKSQVLFKVLAAPRPGQPPPQEQAYLMSEGESQDDIEVQKIDALAAIITFKNHGVIQELSLISGLASDGGQEHDPATVNASRIRLLTARHLATIRRQSGPNPDALNEGDAANSPDPFTGQVVPVQESLSPAPQFSSDPSQIPALQQNRNSTAINNSSAGNAAHVNNGSDETLTPIETLGGDVPPLPQ